MHNILCGQKKAPDDAPAIGSVMAKLRPTQRNLSSYVWLQRCDGNTTVFCSPFISTGGFLGKPFAPLLIGSSANNPSMATYRVSELDTVGGTSPERTRDRYEFLRRLEPSSSNANGRDAAAGWDDLRKRAVELATGPDGAGLLPWNRSPRCCATGMAAIPWGSICSWPAGWWRRGWAL